ncbi:MAG TPA: cytochrome c oxidase assembly factor Coa1 family protein [Thermoanaerobaculia bacterium]|nr:cytochrome c oxidase assembly factor Coa1 family protein [Thermoanaerobaculia bacterium]
MPFETTTPPPPPPPPFHAPPAPPAEPPPRRRSNVWTWLACGCGAALLIFLVVIAVIVGGVFTALRSTTPYRDAVSRAQNDPRVIEALGAPVKSSWLTTGSINTKDNVGDVDMNISMAGSKKKGTVHVVGHKENDRWEYRSMTMTPDGGSPIDLLQSPASSSP